MDNKQTQISRHSYMQKELRAARRSDHPGGAIGTGRAFAEAGRYVSDFGRQALLLAGLLFLIGIIAAATTGNRTFAEFIAWTGWFN